MRMVTLGSTSRVCSRQISDSIALPVNRSGMSASLFGTVVLWPRLETWKGKELSFLPLFV